jgi:hypothetical protein
LKDSKYDVSNGQLQVFAELSPAMKIYYSQGNALSKMIPQDNPIPPNAGSQDKKKERRNAPVPPPI